MAKHIPFSVDEIYYDWQEIEFDGGGHFALVGVAPKKTVNQITSLLDEANLLVEALEIEPVAICRSLLKEESLDSRGLFNKNYAIIDIGASRTSMVVYSRNTILFTASVPISGERITKIISENLKIEKGQAEKAKIICGLDENKARGVINKILSGMIKELNEKINKAFQFYNNNFSDRGPISEILLCGGGANIRGIENVISQSVSIPVKKADTLINLGEAKEKLSKLLSETYNLDVNLPKTSQGKSGGLSITQDSSLTFATAVGLALRGIFISEL